MVEPRDPPLRESDIRPDDLMAGQAERYAADVRRLLERRDEFVEVACPACEGTRAEELFRKYELHYRRCADCATTYVSPRPPPAVLDWYYATSENYAYWNKYVFPASEAARRQKIFVPRVERLAEIVQRRRLGTGVLLEVGAGFGLFCEEIVDRGLFRRVIAVEPTPDLAARCRSRGLEVIESPIEHVALPGLEVDVIANFEVIEHLFSPRDFLEQCRALLAPERGVLMLTCPNGQGFDVSLLGAASSTFDTEHLNYFHPASLTRLLERCGYEVLEVQTPGQLDAELVRKAVLAGQHALPDDPFLRRVLIDDWDRLGAPFQRFLSDNLLSSNMWLVARRAR